MEHKILEFIDECQNHMGQFQDIQQLEEVATQLINIIYFLFEKIDQLKEENSLGFENLQNELNQLQLLYRNSNYKLVIEEDFGRLQVNTLDYCNTIYYKNIKQTKQKIQISVGIQKINIKEKNFLKENIFKYSK